jgi:superfamily I DNA/RNA helicase
MEYSGTYTIIGPPGTGKTTRLGKSVVKILEGGQRVLLTSLTRAAAAEIVGRQLPIDRQCVGTLHSHAFRALGCPEVAEGKLAEWNEDNPDLALAGEASMDVDDPYGERPAGGALGAELMAEYCLLRARCLPREQWPYRVVDFANRWDDWKKQTNRVDFTDLVERAVDCAPPTEPDVLLVDEAQDHSTLEFRLIRRWADQCKAVLIVGDPWQALYTWRGADPSVFNADADVPATHRDVLSQSWRVPERVHAEAVRWVQQLSSYSPIQYRPRAEEGSVSHLEATWGYPDPIIEMALERLDEGQTVMVCGACSYLLSPLLRQLRQAGIPFANPWRAKRGDWNPIRSSTGTSTSTGDRLLAFLRPLTGLPRDMADATSFSFGEQAPENTTWTAADVHLWAELLNARGLMVNGAKKRFEELAKGESALSHVDVDEQFIHRWFVPEAANFLCALLAGTVDVDEALVWLDLRLMAARRTAAAFAMKVIARQGAAALASLPRLYVGTIHSFKGAEADTVIVLPDLSPAGMTGWMEGGEERDSIVRMFYVAMTRAKQDLYLCAPGSGRSVQWLSD